MLLDAGWRRRLGLTKAQGGSPDTLARILDGLSIEELNELCLQLFFTARRAKLLDTGPYGQRCAIVDLNELFTSTHVHCDDCQTRIKKVCDADGNLREITEYFHQAVALVWVGGEIAWPLGWEILTPGEGELTSALRLLERVLPRLLHRDVGRGVPRLGGMRGRRQLLRRWEAMRSEAERRLPSLDPLHLVGLVSPDGRPVPRRVGGGLRGE